MFIDNVIPLPFCPSSCLLDMKCEAAVLPSGHHPNAN